MPYLPSKDSVKDIDIGYYGNNNLGKMKSVYRKGLVNRYGKAMQLIAGLHYNFSFLPGLIHCLKK